MGANITALTQSARNASDGVGALQVADGSLQGISQEQSDLTNTIADIQANLSTEQQTLTAKYSQVNIILQQLPILQQQISQQLAGA